MGDIRTALPKKIGWRKNKTTDTYVETANIGGGTSITPEDPQEEFATGFNWPVGAGYNLSIEVKDPALFAAVNTDQINHEEYEFLITYAGPSGDRTVKIVDVGFTAVPLRYDSIGNFEGFVISGFGYAADSDDILTLTPVIAT